LPFQVGQKDWLKTGMAKFGAKIVQTLALRILSC